MIVTYRKFVWHFVFVILISILLKQTDVRQGTLRGR